MSRRDTRKGMSLSLSEMPCRTVGLKSSKTRDEWRESNPLKVVILAGFPWDGLSKRSRSCPGESSYGNAGVQWRQSKSTKNDRLDRSSIDCLPRERLKYRLVVLGSLFFGING